MTGFKDEAQLWTWMRPKMKGKWERMECIMPEGVPDVLGSEGRALQWIERKIGLPDTDLMEPGQLEFFAWMESCFVPVWTVWGDPKSKLVRFTYGLNFERLHSPSFWRSEYGACIVTV